MNCMKSIKAQQKINQKKLKADIQLNIIRINKFAETFKFNSFFTFKPNCSIYPAVKPRN